MKSGVVAILAFFFSTGMLFQILGCALYSNWWPMLSGLMYILIPLPIIFFHGGGSNGYTNIDGGGDDWEDAAKFLTGFSSVGSLAIPAILLHAGFIEVGAMIFEGLAFFMFALTVVIFQRSKVEEEW